MSACWPGTFIQEAVVLFALVSNSTHDHVVADNFEQHNVARAAKRHDQLTRAAIYPVPPSGG